MCIRDRARRDSRVSILFEMFTHVRVLSRSWTASAKRKQQTAGTTEFPHCLTKEFVALFSRNERRERIQGDQGRERIQRYVLFETFTHVFILFLSTSWTVSAKGKQQTGTMEFPYCLKKQFLALFSRNEGRERIQGDQGREGIQR